MIFTFKIYFYQPKEEIITRKRSQSEVKAKSKRSQSEVKVKKSFISTNKSLIK